MEVPKKYRKYWWVPAVAVPIVVALIANWPNGDGNSETAFTVEVRGTTYHGDVTFTNVAGVIEQAQQMGVEVPPDFSDRLGAALEEVQRGQYAAATDLLVELATELEAPLPVLSDNLAAARIAELTTEDECIGIPGNVENVASAAVRGAMIAAESEYSTGYSAASLLDEDPATIWYPATQSDAPVMIRLSDEFLVSGFAFDQVDPSDGASNQDARVVRLALSNSESVPLTWRDVGTYQLAEGEQGQVFSIGACAVPGRWVQLTLMANHGDTFTARLADFEVHGARPGG